MLLSKHWFNIQTKITLSSIASALDEYKYKLYITSLKVDTKVQINAYVYILYMIDRKTYKNKRTIYI